MLQSVRENPNTTGTAIAYQILDLYRKFSDKVDFKNVQRRVYDALNVLSAMDIIRKNKNMIYYNPDNEYIDDTVHPNTKPKKILQKRQNTEKESIKNHLEILETKKRIQKLQ